MTLSYFLSDPNFFWIIVFIIDIFLLNNHLVALFKSSFVFSDVGLPSRLSSTIVFLAEGQPSTSVIQSLLIYTIVAYLLRTIFHLLQQDLNSLVRLGFSIKDNGQFGRRYFLFCSLLALSQELFISKFVLISIQRQYSWQYGVSFLCLEIHYKSTPTTRQFSSKLVNNWKLVLRYFERTMPIATPCYFSIWLTALSQHHRLFSVDHGRVW